MRRWIIVLISIIVSAVFLWLALRDVPLNQVVAGIQQADFGWIVMSIIGVTGALATRAVRWRGLLDDRIPLMQAFHILNVTMLLNQLPLRAGEVARSLLATHSGVPIITAATSIVIERLIDVVTVVVLLAVATSRLPSAPSSVAQAAALFGVAAVIGFIVLVVFARYPQIAHRVLAWLEARLPLLKRLNGTKRLDEVLDGLRPLTRAKHAIHVTIWTIFGWAFSLFTFYALERALDIHGVDLIIGSMLGVGLAAFSIAIPVSVAAIGPFEGAVRVAGDAVGISAVASTTLGFLFHGITVLVYAFFGVIGLIALGVSLGDVLKQPTTSTTQAPAS